MVEIKFLNKRISPMAKPLSEVRREMYSFNSTRVEHLLKCFLFPNSQSFHHWCLELKTFPKEVPALKGRNRRPTSKQIFEWSWLADDRTPHSIEGYIDDINFEGKYPEVDLASIDLEAAFRFLEEYHIWLSEILSSKGEIRGSEIDAKLKELLRKYWRL